MTISDKAIEAAISALGERYGDDAYCKEREYVLAILEAAAPHMLAAVPEEAAIAAANSISQSSSMRFDGFWSRVEDLEPEDREYALREARAALEAAAAHMFITIHHPDIENHARSFNEGYETAIAQGLADDPSLAQDWLDGKLADAGAKALEDAAAQILTNDPLDYWANHLPEGLGFQQAMSHWLKAHAAAVRGEDAHV